MGDEDEGCVVVNEVDFFVCFFAGCFEASPVRRPTFGLEKNESIN